MVYRQVVEKTINNGSYAIAHYLNDHGYKTANGSKSTSMAITRMLSTPLARGYTKEGQTSEALQRLKIISEEEAARIDEILEHRAKVDEEKRRIVTKQKAEQCWQAISSVPIVVVG